MNTGRSGQVDPGRVPSLAGARSHDRRGTRRPADVSFLNNIMGGPPASDSAVRAWHPDPGFNPRGRSIDAAMFRHQPCAVKSFPWLGAAILLLLSPRAHSADVNRPADQPDASRWFGFNLLEKFTLQRSAPFREEDFKWIAELGFSFVRMPMDYRCYTEADDWLKFRESALREIDQALAWGERYNVHVCLNLHRAPGFCINPPAEERDLWTDPVAQDAFVAHWVMFAQRYRTVPSTRLSFNLLNEPTRNTRESYLRVNRRAIAAIHAVDPRRLIVVDGNNVGRDPTPELLPLANVMQATRGYHPSSVSHYKANWVKGADTWKAPAWPPPPLTGRLYGPTKPDLRSPLVLRGEFPAGTEIVMPVVQLSVSATLRASAGAAVVAETNFDPKSAPAEWAPVPTGSTWQYHRPVGPRAFRVLLTQPVRELAIENVKGDWLEFDSLTLRIPGREPATTMTDSSWGRRQAAHDVTPDGRITPAAGISPAQPLRDYLKPWREIAAQGEAVFVGEWGCFNRTPHPVALAWMQAWLEQWHEARFGWALWNFRGSFGVLDSGRTDVVYEDWRGHKLDRKMLTLLQRFAVGGTPPVSPR